MCSFKQRLDQGPQSPLGGELSFERRGKLALSAGAVLGHHQFLRHLQGECATAISPDEAQRHIDTRGHPG